MTIQSTNTLDKRISWSLMFYYIANAINYMVKSVFSISGSLWSLTSRIIGISIVFMLLISLGEVYRRSSKVLIGSILFFFVLYFISVIMSYFRAEPLNLIGEIAIQTFLFYIPVGVYAISVYDKKTLYEIMLKSSNVLFVLMAFRIMANFDFLLTGKEELEYSMSFGYILIVPTLFHFNEFFNYKRIVYLILFVLEVFGIVIFASRGVLLSILAFVLYKLLISSRRVVLKVFWVLFFVGLFVVLQSYGDALLSQTIKSLDKMGIQSRTLSMLEANAIDDDSGRKQLFSISFEMIEEKPWFGWGIGGEYYHFASKIGQIKADTACTSHNGVLQAMVQFGIVGGLIASLLIVLPIFGIRKVVNPFLKEIIVIYYCAYAIPAVTISSGFFVQPQIAIYLFLYYFGRKADSLCQAL